METHSPPSRPLLLLNICAKIACQRHDLEMACVGQAQETLPDGAEHRLRGGDGVAGEFELRPGEVGVRDAGGEETCLLNPKKG